ncbi:MAG: hypothetical protein D6828_03730, partial [Nitrospirae bacterium]
MAGHKTINNLIKEHILNLIRRNIYYVTDKGNWSFDWDAYYITGGLKKLGLSAYITDNPWRFKRQIIHFGDRYA